MWWFKKSIKVGQYYPNTHTRVSNLRISNLSLTLYCIHRSICIYKIKWGYNIATLNFMPNMSVSVWNVFIKLYGNIFLRILEWCQKFKFTWYKDLSLSRWVTPPLNANTSHQHIPLMKTPHKNMHHPFKHRTDSPHTHTHHITPQLCPEWDCPKGDGVCSNISD